MNKIKFLSIIIFIICISSKVNICQVNNSAYTMFGVGQLVDHSFGINKSLGGTGIAFKSDNNINYQNPASYLGILPGSMVIEGGIYGTYNSSESKRNSLSSSDINFNYFSLSFYFADWWASSFGVTPFSDIDYSFETEGEIEGELVTLEQTYERTGGISKFYFGNSFKILKSLAVGLNINFLSGPIKETETVVGNESFEGYVIENKKTSFAANPEFGLQYTIYDDDLSYCFGAVYNQEIEFHSFDRLRYSSSDTVKTLDNSDDEKESLIVPQKFGFGIAVTKGNNFRLGIDYEYQGWTNMNFINSDLSTKNSNRFSVGVEYSVNKRFTEKWYEKLKYRFGANYKDSYLEIEKERISSFALNQGVGIPIDNGSCINFSIEYGQEGTNNSGLVKNSYLMAYFNLSFSQFWAQTPDR